VSTGEWIAVVGIFITSMTALYSSLRFMVRAIMRELQPNGGASLKDQVNRIEQRLDHIYTEFLRK
jgi:hypothetical protein